MDDNGSTVATTQRKRESGVLVRFKNGSMMAYFNTEAQGKSRVGDCGEGWLRTHGDINLLFSLSLNGAHESQACPATD